MIGHRYSSLGTESETTESGGKHDVINGGNNAGHITSLVQHTPTCGDEHTEPYSLMLQRALHDVVLPLSFSIWVDNVSLLDLTIASV